jgi:sugar lactone lactonase YvrE
MKLSVVVAAALAIGTPAHAGIELVKKVGYADELGTLRLRDIGDPRYVAITTLSRADKDVDLDVLDLATGTTHRVAATRRSIERALGATNLEGELVSYTPAKVGLHITDGILERARHHWYVELDVKTGKVARTISLGTFDDDAELVFVATDGARDTAWFTLASYGEGLRDHSHVKGPTSLVLRKLDLDTLQTTDTMTIALPGRPMASGYEDQLMVHHAPDYSWFAIAEYDERTFHSKPAARVYFLDPDHGATFAVPALDTTYGVAFSRDGAYAYLGSAQLGTIARVDMASHKIDKTTTGPTLTHDLAISPDGSKLFVIGSSRQYGELALPKLGGRTAHKHDPTVAAGAEQLSGGGHVSSDGKYYVLREAVTVRKDRTVADPHELVIAKITD